MSSLDADAPVAAAEAIVDRLERRLGTERATLAGITQAKRPLAFEAMALEDRAAINRLAALAREEAAARQKVYDLELAREVGNERLAAAKAAELVARRPRYRSTTYRRIGGLEIAVGEEFEWLGWPSATDIHSIRPRGSF